MSISFDLLESEILNLPVLQRAQLLDRIVASLEHDAQWEAEWAKEANRREAALAAGQAQWLPGEQVVASLRARLA